MARRVSLATLGATALIALTGAGGASAATSQVWATLALQATPMHLGIDADGYVYADDTQSGSGYFRVPPSGGGPFSPTFVTGFNGDPAVYLTDLAVDPAGNVFLANEVSTGANTPSGYPGGVIKIPTGGTKVNLPTAAQLSYRLAIDGSGNIYTSTPFNSTITKLDAPGNQVWARAVGADVDDIAIDRSGTVYTANPNADTVSRITPEGVVDTVFAHVGDQPRWIATDSAGNVYTSNQGDGTVSKVTPQGAGTVLDTGSQGSTPQGVGVDAAGQVYVVNGFNAFGAGARNATLSRIALDGTASVIADLGVLGASGLTIDRDGNVFVAFNSKSAAEPNRPGIAKVTVEPNPPPAPVAVLSGTSATVTAQPSVTGTPTGVTVTASPGGRTCSIAAAEGSCTFPDLSRGTTYTFTATSTGPGGTSAASAASNAVTVAADGGATPRSVSRLRGSTRCVAGRCTTAGRLPAGATSVRQVATRLPVATARLRETATSRVRGRCTVTASAYTCTVRLARGRWRLATTASDATGAIATSRRTVSVAARVPVIHVTG